MSKLNNSPKKHTMFNDTEIPKNYIPQHPLFEAAEPRPLNGYGTPLSHFLERDEGILYIKRTYLESYLKGSVGFTEKLFSVNDRTKLDECISLMRQYVNLISSYIEQAVNDGNLGYMTIEQILGYGDVTNLRRRLTSQI